MNSRALRPRIPAQTTEYMQSRCAPVPSASRIALSRSTPRRPRSGTASDFGGGADAHEALEFALKWRHWGGGDDEDIYVHFGITAREYYLRVRRLLNSLAARDLSFEERSQLIAICDKRLL